MSLSGEFKCEWTIDEMPTRTSRDGAYPPSCCQVYSYLCRVMYNRRNKMNPLWNSLVIGGVEPSTGVPFLGMVSMQGTHYVDSYVTTGAHVTTGANYKQGGLLRFARNPHSVDMELQVTL